MDKFVSKNIVPDRGFVERYVESSRFGEVNAFFHITKMARYVGELLSELGAPPLPRVKVVINAHHAACESGGVRDGVRGTRQWLPFQGGHYRLPGRKQCMTGLSPDGEIHLGPGWRLLDEGALVQWRGNKYRAAASHNAGIIYHEYGHHITQHTADFNANATRAPGRQSNKKSAIDEGTCDYFAAALLGTPHIWIWHHRHDSQAVHRRSLVSKKTMRDYDHSPSADPHDNGTIWGAALWDVRSALALRSRHGGRDFDKVALAALLHLRAWGGDDGPIPRRTIMRFRRSYSSGLRALLRADEELHRGEHSGVILEAFRKRGIDWISSSRPGVPASSWEVAS